MDQNLNDQLDGVIAVKRLEETFGFFPALLISEGPKPSLQTVPTELYGFIKKQEGVAEVVQKALSVFWMTQLYGARGP